MIRSIIHDQAYRKLSLTAHPDKSTAENATVVFRRITKAYEVLTGNSSRELFNYYLDHPRVTPSTSLHTFLSTGR